MRRYLSDDGDVTVDDYGVTVDDYDVTVDVGDVCFFLVSFSGLTFFCQAKIIFTEERKSKCKNEQQVQV